MVVFNEAARLYGALPSRHRLEVDAANQLHDLANGNHVPWGDTWDCAKDAALNLRRLYLDLSNELNARWPNAHLMPPAITADARDLVKLGYWALYSVLGPLINARQAVRGGYPPIQADTDFENDLMNILARVWASHAHLEGVTVVQLLSGANASMNAIVNEITLWGNVGQMLAPNISILGFVELLARVIAQQSNDLATLRTRLNATSTRGPPNLQYFHRATPQCLFVCAGQNNGGRTIVVTSTVDNWQGYGRVNDEMQNFRQTVRPTSAPVAGPAAFPVNVRSQGIRHEFDLVHNNANAPGTNADAIRLGVITAWQLVAANFTNHANEQCLPLRVPSFSVKPRCLRCQGLFRYNIAHNNQLQNEETAFRARKGQALNTMCFRNFGCAETIGHFYCAAAAAAANH